VNSSEKIKFIESIVKGQLEWVLSWPEEARNRQPSAEDVLNTILVVVRGCIDDE